MWAPPPSSPLHSRGGWGDPVLCQYVNNGLVYYYVCNEMFLHTPSGGFYTPNIQLFDVVQIFWVEGGILLVMFSLKESKYLPS